MHSFPRHLLSRCVTALLLLAASTACEQQSSGNGNQGARIVPVITSVASVQPLSDRIEAVGTTRASDSLEITARVSNAVTRIGFAEGAFVDRGQVLVELESSEARANLAEAEATLAEIRTQHRRTQELIRSNAVSQSQLDQQAAQLKAAEARVAAARAVLADHTLRAPFDGRVGLRRVSVGAQVAPGTVITTLDQVTTMNLDFPIPESYLAVLNEGLSILARSVAYPDERFAGTVHSIDSRIDPVSRMVTVRAQLDNSDRRLRPGMFMTVTLEKDRRETIVVPEIALVTEGRHRYLFVIEDDTAIQREVRTGARQRGIVEIIEGLEPGTEYVTEGTQSLRHGVPIRRVGESS